VWDLLQLAASLDKDWEAKLAGAAVEAGQQVVAAEEKLQASMAACSAKQEAAGGLLLAHSRVLHALMCYTITHVCFSPSKPVASHLTQ
jgi:hypothetical protein